MQQAKNTDKDRIDLIIGVIAVAVVLALFGWLIFRLNRSANMGATLNTAGEIVAQGETVRGSEQTFTYLPPAEIAEGTPIVWTIDGETVAQSAYVKDEPITLNYRPDEAGVHRIAATVGKYTQVYSVKTERPTLTVTAPTLTITYGDPLPQLLPEAVGFVADEGQDYCAEECALDTNALDVGVYRIAPKQCDYLDYRTEYAEGTLTVLPRELTVVGNLTKCYDGTNALKLPTVTVEGVLEGDDVCVECETLYLDGKDVGRKNVLLGTAQLAGEDAHNYKLPDCAQATVYPRALALQGLCVSDKQYDGTTKATIDKMGTLIGVCEGDSVAIGSITARFDSAEVGMRDITVEGATLVGADKENYVLLRVDKCKAEITEKVSFWDKLLQKERVAEG